MTNDLYPSDDAHDVYDDDDDDDDDVDDKVSEKTARLTALGPEWALPNSPPDLKFPISSGLGNLTSTP